MAKVISIINHKGGVGKTTTTQNLGKALSLQGHIVLLIDLDPQGNLSQGYGIEQPNEQTVHALMGERKSLPKVELHENLFISPSDLDLTDAEFKLQTEVGGFAVLRDLIQKETAFDYVLIDCPPSLNILTQNALASCTEVIICIEPRFYSAKGLEKMVEIIEKVQRSINPGLNKMHALFTKKHTNRVIQDSVINFIKESDFIHVFETNIRENTSIEEACSNQMDIFSYNDKSNGAKDYMSLSKEVVHG